MLLLLLSDEIGICNCSKTLEFTSHLRVRFEVGFQVLHGLPLPHVLPDQVVRVPRALEALAEHIHVVFHGENALELSLLSTSLLFFELGEEVQVVLR